jgi:glycosyltransferase involved in cell wall biosynthesis
MWDLDRRLAPLATRIVCNTDAIRERFRGSRGWEKSVTIMSAVDLAEFNPEVSGAEVRSELGVPDDTPIVGLVGRLSPGKGHDVFVEAAIRLVREGVRARFLVVGATIFPSDVGPEEKLRQRIREAGVVNAVILTGFRRDVARVMRALDVLVLASDAEPAGRVLFEAMASGTAIVATNTGGTPEIVGDGEHGLLVPPRDPAALARAIGRLLDDAPMRRKLAAAGAARARAQFGVGPYVQKIMAEYDAIVGRPREASRA